MNQPPSTLCLRPQPARVEVGGQNRKSDLIPLFTVPPLSLHLFRGEARRSLYATLFYISLPFSPLLGPQAVYCCPASCRSDSAQPECPGADPFVKRHRREPDPIRRHGQETGRAWWRHRPEYHLQGQPPGRSDDSADRQATYR